MRKSVCRRYSWTILLAFIVPEARAGDLGDIRKRVDGLVHTQLTTLWYPRALEETRGGFHQNFGRDWTSLPDDNCALVYQARLTWTAATFAAYSERDRKTFEGYSRHGVDFLDRVMRDGQQGGFHWVVGPDGKVDERLGTEKHVYGTAFALYAASKAYEVTRDEKAIKVARDAFDWLERHAHDGRDGGYFEALTREGKPIVAWSPDAPMGKRTDRLGIYYGFKTMNSHIHLLEAVAEYYRVEPKPIVRERLEELLTVVRDRIAVEPGALNLYLTRSWHATPAHDSFGHDVETAYLLVEAAEALGKPDDAAT